MSDRIPVLVRTSADGALRAVLDVSSFGYRRYTLASLPERLFTGLDEARRPASLIQIPAIEAREVRTPLAALCETDDGKSEAWPTETRRALARLEAIWL